MWYFFFYMEYQRVEDIYIIGGDGVDSIFVFLGAVSQWVVDIAIDSNIIGLEIALDKVLERGHIISGNCNRLMRGENLSHHLI